jgi:hypothetical protein
MSYEIAFWVIQVSFPLLCLSFVLLHSVAYIHGGVLVALSGFVRPC